MVAPFIVKAKVAHGWWVWLKIAVPATLNAIAGLLILIPSVIFIIWILDQASNASNDFYGTINPIFIACIALAGVACFPAYKGLDKIFKAVPAYAPRFNDAGGSAKFGTLRDLKKAGLLEYKQDYVYMGMFGKEAIFYSQNRHIMIEGYTQSGKGARIIIPIIYWANKRSIFALDVKGGELAAITALHRRNSLVINPLQELVSKKRPYMRSCGFNPLATLNIANKNFALAANNIANALVRMASSREEHWPLGARMLVSALIMYVKYKEYSYIKDGVQLNKLYEAGYNANLGAVRTILGYPTSKLKEELEKMYQFGPRVMADKVGTFLDEENKNFREIGSIVKTAQVQTDFLNDPNIRRDMSNHPVINGKPFHFGMLRGYVNPEDKKPVILTVYVVLPENSLGSYSTYLRLLTAIAISQLQENASFDNYKKEKIKPLLIIDEAGNLGYLEALDLAMTTSAGKDIQILTAWQDQSQIEKHYGYEGKKTMMTCQGAYLNVGAGYDTANYLQHRIGNQTIVSTTYANHPDSKESSKSDNATVVPLMTASSIQGLKPGEGIGFIEPCQGIPFRLNFPGYYPGKGNLNLKGLENHPFHHG